MSKTIRLTLELNEDELQILERFMRQCKEEDLEIKDCLIQLMKQDLEGIRLPADDKFEELNHRLQAIEAKLGLQKDEDFDFYAWLEVELRRLKKERIATRRLCEKIGMKESTFHSLKNRRFFKITDKKTIKEAISELNEELIL